MPTLDWIGKKAVLNHHREVPYRLLRSDAKLSAGDPESGNLLVQGDNLDALKALLPYYAGQVKCIYIDPPYNTGEEGWVYNDASNDPILRRWLGKVVGRELEDLSRHDKWLCMMYPRLQLLWKFLSRTGSLWVSIDDNENGHLRALLDEVCGANNFITAIVWQQRKSRENRKTFSNNHEYILVYAKNPGEFASSRNPLELGEEVRARYKNPDKDPRGPWQSVSANAQGGHATQAQFYVLVAPNGKRHELPTGRCWVYTEGKMREEIATGNIWFGKTGNGVPRMKKFLPGPTEGLVPETLWTADEVGTNDEAKKSLINLHLGDDVFDTPKPETLIRRIFQIASNPGELVMDSFLGSGTTAAVALKMRRRWIGIEIGEHAYTQCVPRLRKVIGGEQGGISTAERWTGGGGYRYCTLSRALFEADGSIAPSVSFSDLAYCVFFAETGQPAPTRKDAGVSPLIGKHNGVAYYLLFNGILGDKQPDGGNILTSRVLAELPPYDGYRVIFGEGCWLGATRLKDERITFKQIPYQIKT